MAAIVMTLLQLGWQPTEASWWTDSSGVEWASAARVGQRLASKTCDLHGRRIRVDAVDVFWAQATTHRGVEGLQHTPSTAQHSKLKIWF